MVNALGPQNPWKNEGFTVHPKNMGEITNKNEGNVGSHGTCTIMDPDPTLG